MIDSTSIFKLNWTALIALQRPLLEWWGISLDNFLLEITGIKFKWFYLLTQEPQTSLSARENSSRFTGHFCLRQRIHWLYRHDTILHLLAIVSDAKLNYRQPGMKKKSWAEGQFIIWIILLVFLWAALPISTPCSTSVLFQKTHFSIF